MIGRLWTLTRFEVAKLLGRRILLVPQGLFSRSGPLMRSLLAPPFVAIVLALIFLAPLFVGNAQYVIDRALEMTKVAQADPFKNAWVALANSTLKGQYLAMLFLLVIGGTSMAEEAQFGTLKAILTRPYRRSELVLAKSASLFVFVLLVVVALAASGILMGAIRYDYVAITDPYYTNLVKSSAAEMWRATAQGFAMLIVPLFALVAYALFISTVVDQPGYAVGVCVGGALMVAAVGFTIDDLAPYLFINVALKPLNLLLDKGNQFDGSTFTALGAARDTGVCGLWGGLFLGLTIWRLNARDIGD